MNRCTACVTVSANNNNNLDCFAIPGVFVAAVLGLCSQQTDPAPFARELAAPRPRPLPTKTCHEERTHEVPASLYASTCFLTRRGKRAAGWRAATR